MPVKGSYHAEMALRILLNSIDIAANKYKRHIVPWISGEWKAFFQFAIDDWLYSCYWFLCSCIRSRVSKSDRSEESLFSPLLRFAVYAGMRCDSTIASLYVIVSFLFDSGFLSNIAGIYNTFINSLLLDCVRILIWARLQWPHPATARKPGEKWNLAVLFGQRLFTI